MRLVVRFCHAFFAVLFRRLYSQTGATRGGHYSVVIAYNSVVMSLEAGQGARGQAGAPGLARPGTPPTCASAPRRSSDPRTTGYKSLVAPRPGLEPGTCGLTVRRSTS